jgi:DNA-binding transcriptional ArsR family regulator
VDGDADIAAPAALLGDPRRARIVMALFDGRALPASVLAAEAGVAPSTASEHLARLLDGGLLRAERYGRHRYYRLAGGEVAAAVEALARVAPPAPVRSLRQGLQAEALRRARTCYDHLAGRLGTAIMASMLERGLLDGGDGRFDARAAAHDRPSAFGRDLDYRLTAAGAYELARLGVAIDGGRSGRPAVRYCVDWTEQRHHLSGAAGAALAGRLFELGWLRRAERGRALHVTAAGARGLEDAFGIEPALLAAA